jgi:hypothetical protein
LEDLNDPSLLTCVSHGRSRLRRLTLTSGANAKQRNACPKAIAIPSVTTENNGIKE